MQNDVCRVPIAATYTVYKGGGGPVMTAAEYAEISADAIAKFLVDKLGVDAIFSGEAGA